MVRWIVVAAAVLTSLAAAFQWLFRERWNPLAGDYLTFFAASQIPADLLYVGPHFNFIYPPTGIAFVRLLSHADYWAGYIILTIASATAFILAVRNVASPKIALLALLSASAIQGLALGQTSMLLAAGLFWALAMDGFRRGFVIGVLAAIKPQLFLATPFVFLVRREYSAIAGMAIGGLAASLAATAVFGVQPWVEWLHLVPQFRSYLHDHNIIDSAVTLAGMADTFGLPVAPFLLAGLAIASWLVWNCRKLEDPLATAAIIGGASVVASPYALPHDCVAVIPALVAGLLRGPRLSSIPAVAVFSGAFMPITLPAFLLLWQRELMTDARRSPRPCNEATDISLQSD